ncbi:hypothetical protein Tco_0511194 [Tanacetum coccineum]
MLVITPLETTKVPTKPIQDSPCYDDLTSDQKKIRTVSKNLTRKIQVKQRDTPDCCNLNLRMDVTQEGQGRSKPSSCSYGPDLRCDRVLHLVVIQGLGSNYKRSRLEFQSTMILVLQLEQNVFMDSSLNKGCLGILKLECSTKVLFIRELITVIEVRLVMTSKEYQTQMKERIYNVKNKLEAMRAESSHKHEELLDILKKFAISIGRAKEAEEWKKWRDLKRAQEASEDII